ncbi:MAG: isoaspartyl peptidase/L-asparaginase, partial [Candidatus Dormibacteria bacterium]
MLVGDQIAEGEAVVGGHEVDAGARAAAIVGVEVAAPGQAVGEPRHPQLGAPPVVAHRVAILAVPLRPAHREVADLVAARTDCGEGVIPISRSGTVGAVAVDRDGHLATATSTGGRLGKLPGRV